MGTRCSPVGRGLPGRISAVYLMMNTNYGDQGVVNARALAEVLGVRMGQPQLL